MSIGSEFKLAGIIPVRNTASTFKMEHNPELISVCPTFVFTEPINSGVLRFLQKNSDITVHSTLSPTLVPKIVCIIFKNSVKSFKVFCS